MARDKAPLRVLEVEYCGGTFTATCRSCFLECIECGNTMREAIDNLPCDEELREFAAVEGARSE